MDTTQNKIQKEATLDGFMSVFDALPISLNDLACRVGTNQSYLSRILNGRRSCSNAFVKAIYEQLCCSASDLFEKPGACRLAEIRLAFLLREAQRAKAELDRLQEASEAEREAA